MVIDVFADFICPWCLIGMTRLEQVLVDDKDVEVRLHPFLLDPSIGKEGRDIMKMLRERYGRDPREMWSVVEEHARDAGIELDLSKQPMAYRAVDAHTLVRHAHDKGTQRALAQALYRAYFLAAQNITERAVLKDVARGHGFDDAEVDRILDDVGEARDTETSCLAASEQGVRGVPLFVFNEKLAVSGAQKNEVLRAAMVKASSA
ncbi:MAG TPA: DsbA family oxidoreductase [Myxococcota bacterium]|jgi:predicted DsbA family dithiol-disulfide isomerase